jgi:hypothetical protein
MIFSENRSPLFRIMLQERTSMPAADSGAKEISSGFFDPSGTDDGRLWRIEMPPGVQDRLGTKAAQREDEDDVLECSHLTATILGGPKSR